MKIPFLLLRFLSVNSSTRLCRIQFQIRPFQGDLVDNYESNSTTFVFLGSNRSKIPTKLEMEKVPLFSG